MTTYQKQFEDMQKNNALTPLVSSLKTEFAEGEVITGILVDIKLVEFEKTKSTVNSYVVDTDDNRISFIMGSATDAQLEGTIVINEPYAFMFIEKKEISDSRTVNVWQVYPLSEKGAAKHGTESKKVNSRQDGK